MKNFQHDIRNFQILWYIPVVVVENIAACIIIIIIKKSLLSCNHKLSMLTHVHFGDGFSLSKRSTK